jgi:YD repeat-containing protein
LTLNDFPWVRRPGSTHFRTDAAGNRGIHLRRGKPPRNDDSAGAGPSRLHLRQRQSANPHHARLVIVQFAYDTSNRRTSLTLPNGILVEYAYDAASRVTSITYKQNGTTLLGDLTYEYDKSGNRTKIGGSWARTGMPEPLTTTNYDANNRQLTFTDKTLAYDDNGNLQSITAQHCTIGTPEISWLVSMGRM